MKTIVLYHANCTDGFGAAWAAWKNLGDKDTSYVPINYGEAPPDVSGCRVFILDFSFPKPVFEKLVEDAYHVALIDHHKTAFEELGFGDMERVETRSDKCYILLDKSRSGAWLSWTRFHDAVAVPPMIARIDDRDRWEFSLPNTREFHAGINAMKPWSFEQWDRLKLDSVVDQGATLLRDHLQKVEEVSRQARRMRLCGHWGLMVNASYFLTSDLGHTLAVRSGTFGLVYHIDKNGVVQCSLRSNGDFDVSVMARSFGGGGHKNAAGFKVDMETLVQWVCSNS